MNPRLMRLLSGPIVPENAGLSVRPLAVYGPEPQREALAAVWRGFDRVSLVASPCREDPQQLPLGCIALVAFGSWEDGACAAAQQVVSALRQCQIPVYVVGMGPFPDSTAQQLWATALVASGANLVGSTRDTAGRDLRLLLRQQYAHPATADRLRRYEEELSDALQWRRPKDVRLLYRRILQLQRSPEASLYGWRLGALAAFGLGDLSRARLHIERALQLDPWHLWSFHLARLTPPCLPAAEGQLRSTPGLPPDLTPLDPTHPASCVLLSQPLDLDFVSYVLTVMEDAAGAGDPVKVLALGRWLQLGDIRCFARASRLWELIGQSQLRTGARSLGLRALRKSVSLAENQVQPRGSCAEQTLSLVARNSMPQP